MERLITKTNKNKTKTRVRSIPPDYRPSGIVSKQKLKSAKPKLKFKKIIIFILIGLLLFLNLKLWRKHYLIYNPFPNGYTEEAVHDELGVLDKATPPTLKDGETPAEYNKRTMPSVNKVPVTKNEPVGLLTQKDLNLHEKGLLTSGDIKWVVARAIMRTVAFAEGTWYPGKSEEETYKVIYGYKYFDSYDDHPDYVNCAGAYCSSAAGAYQFMPYTWYPLVNRYEHWYTKVGAFAPQNQDLGFLRYFTEVGSWSRLEKGISVKNQVIYVSEDALWDSISHAAPVWCSLPGSNRGACAGQPQKSWDSIKEVFYRELNKEQGL